MDPEIMRYSVRVKLWRSSRGRSSWVEATTNVAVAAFALSQYIGARHPEWHVWVADEHGREIVEGED